ncbi:hypothetical protein K470DRAFT_258602 [Piedraia hortae CBS 480.64]|uniref:Nuclear condensin complex subunit 3 C-terminal domain-containing protein n=1 Tax=Piedraia hortae CBS 480.64 TaxID=1314780 RepID=A0A6A7BX08_9PEZI|nr:hypothetical protein K470DRAFT_258602 [Piedraia hortae CBS 480.64]
MPPRGASGRGRQAAASVSATKLPDEGPDTSLRQTICGVFREAQKTVTGHRKAVISLRKVQEACCYESVVPQHKQKKPTDEEYDEEDFNGEVTRCVLRVLAVHKTEPEGDRVVRFLGTFLAVASEKDGEIAAAADPDATSVPETPTSRLATHVLSTLLPLLRAKDKTVRFRAAQTVSHVIHSLESLDDQLYHQLRLALLKRIHDKEAAVRLQAVNGLGVLAAEVEEDAAGGTDDESDDGAGKGVLEKLVAGLQNDPAAEVRRKLLLDLPRTRNVLPYLLERARDVDGTTRRAVYARLLPALGDFRHLSLTHREKLLRWGLLDRDTNVRKATARLFCERWIEDCAARPAETTAEEAEEAAMGAQQAAPPSFDALLELLERIDVVNSGGEGGIGLAAMSEFWAGRPDYVDYVSFPDVFWDDLTPERAFVARTFNDYCRAAGREGGGSDGEDKLPEVARFGFLLERELRKLHQLVELAGNGNDEAEVEVPQLEFVVEQMLHMALTFDYSDEVGRRKVFGLLREALADPSLPEETTRLAVDLLRLVCGPDRKGEREFCGLVLEAVAEVHDTISDGDESFRSATEHVDDVESQTSVRVRKRSEDELEAVRLKEIVINMKCLHMAMSMLSNVQCRLTDNSNLVTMVDNLVVPAVRSQEAPIRERGFCCLGLCCLLSADFAREQLDLFLHCFEKARKHPVLQTITLQILGDIIVTHPSIIVNTDDDGEDSPGHRGRVLSALSQSLRSADSEVQAVGATALAKAMLSQLITDTDLLQELVVVYFDKDTASNSALRQGLSYFLPVYCHSRAENSARMASVATGILCKLSTLHSSADDEVDDDAAYRDSDTESPDEAIKLSVAGQMLVDWTDPRKNLATSDAHFILSQEILDRLTTGTNVEKDERKALFSMLGKVCLEGIEGERLATLLEQVTAAQEEGAATDALGRNVLAKLRTNLLKAVRDYAAEQRGAVEETTMVTMTELPIR